MDKQLEEVEVEVKEENGDDLYYMMNMPKEFMEAEEDEKIRLVKIFAAASSDSEFTIEDVAKLTESL